MREEKSCLLTSRWEISKPACGLLVTNPMQMSDRTYAA